MRLFAKPAFIMRKQTGLTFRMKTQKYNDEEKIDRFPDYQLKDDRNNFSAITSTITLLRAV